MPSTAPAVRSFIRRHRLLGAGDRVAVALSGGSDSVALSCLLSDLAKDEAWDVAGLIHVNHGLRGAESDADEAFCRDQAARWHLPLHVQRVDVAGRAREARQSIEAAARHLRYTAFEAGAVALGATSVATGHTEDDQAETLLLRLVRGASSRGLAGIRVRRGRFVRPLLAARREELRAWLAARGQPFREDSSNADPAIPRNRLRRDVVPVLEEFAAQVVPALGRAAALLADDETFLEAAAIEEAARLVLGGVTPDHRQIDAAGLAKLPPALSRRVLRRAAASIGAPAWSARHMIDLLDLAGRDRGRLDLPGVSARRSGSMLELRIRSLEMSVGPFEYGLPLPGRVDVPEAGVTIEAAEGRPDALPGRVSSCDVLVSKSCMELPLRVRSRRAGDRFRPLGASGSRKLQDVLVDRKVPRHRRDRVPIVVDAKDRILWVVGVTLAEACRVPAAQSGVVTLKSSPLAGER